MMFLIVNIGSTSIKTRLFGANLIAKGQLYADYSVLTNTVLTSHFSSEVMHHQTQTFASVEDVIRFVFSQWQQHLQKQHIALMAIGHRIVHGGLDFNEVTVIDQDTMDDLAQLDTYASLHNPINRLGISIAAKSFLRLLNMVSLIQHFTILCRNRRVVTRFPKIVAGYGITSLWISRYFLFLCTTSNCCDSKASGYFSEFDCLTFRGW